MGWKEIRQDLASVGEIIDGWISGIEVSDLEKDIALEKLRRVYGTVKAARCGETAEECPVRAASQVEKTGYGVPSESGEHSVSAVGAEYISSAEGAAQTVSAECAERVYQADGAGRVSSTENAENPPNAAEHTHYPESPQPTPFYAAPRESAAAGTATEEDLSADNVLAEIDETVVVTDDNTADPVRCRIDRKALLSLYDDCPAASEKTTASDIRTPENEGFAETPLPKTAGLRTEITPADRFAMIRDMFGSDEGAYERTIDRFDRFTDLGDAVVYMYENFNWNPADEGVRRFVDILERKLA